MSKDGVCRLRNAIKHLGSKLFRAVFLINQSLSVKLFIYSGLLVLIPMIVVGTISYRQTADVMEKEAQQYSWQIIEQVNLHVEYYVRDFEIQTLKIMNHPDMNRFLRLKSVEEANQSDIRNSILQLLQNAAYSRSDISRISIILDNIQNIDTSGDKSKEPLDKITKEYWYDSVPLNGDAVLISRYIKLSEKPEPVLSIVRRIFSPLSLQPIGMIITDVNYKRFQEISERVTIGRNGPMFILDKQGHYVYHPDTHMLGEKANIEHLATLQNTASGSFVSKENNYLTYNYSSFLGWTLITSIPHPELIKGINNIGRTMLWTTVITLFIAYVLGVGFASSLIRPIRNLQRYMKRIEVGDFNSKITVQSEDEIGQLTHGFNKMVMKLKELLDEIYFSKLKETETSLRQKETELKMLESQVNPHFLYNSLETIRGMALEHDMDHIADMALSVAKLLRYNLKETSPTVPLLKEIAICEMYLRIQKYRFEEKLEYEIQIPEWAKVQPIVRFSLQPIVENCVIHGIEPNANRNKIIISAEKDSEHSYIVRIADTGMGIEEERLEQIRNNLLQVNPIADAMQIGILNVHKRIQFLCGEDYGIFIHSQGAKGTTVEIRLPLY
jgi:two-component system, sensor histidine kinase YesM